MEDHTQFREQSRLRVSMLHPEAVLQQIDWNVTTSDNPNEIVLDCLLTGILSFPNNCFHVAIIVPEVNEHYLAYNNLINDFINQTIRTDYEVRSGNNTFTKDVALTTKSLPFSTIVYLLTKKITVDIEKVQSYFKSAGLVLRIRDESYWHKMEEILKQSVFLCHDSRDKTTFVDELYFALTSRFIHVWYDKRSLGVGDSLIAKITEGIKDCRYAILVLSKNFLSNKKWVDVELQSLMTKQIHSMEKVILPLWLDITEKNLENEGYYWLLDKLAFKASEGTYSIADKIEAMLRKPKS